MLSILSPPPVSKGYRNMRSRVDDPMRIPTRGRRDYLYRGLTVHALPRLTATHVPGFRLASLALRAWFVIAQGFFDAA